MSPFTLRSSVRSRALARLGLLLSLITAAAASARGQGIRPKSLLIYYGWPSGINGAFSVTDAAAELGVYDYVVLGDGLCLSSHPDHANTVDILAQSTMGGTQVFGYVDLGVSTQGLDLDEVQSRIDQWNAMGVAGIFLDDFGYDFQTTRARQNAAVDYAHAAGLSVIANAFLPDDAFGRTPDSTTNPDALATHLGAQDFYLYESHQIRLGQYEDPAAWLTKGLALERYRQQLGFRILSITTTDADDVGAFDQDHFFYSWYSALLFGHEATGWGEYSFSSAGASNGQAPWRDRPSEDVGQAFLGAVAHVGSMVARTTDRGQVVVDTFAHSYGVQIASAGGSLPGREASGGLGAPYPNPCNPRARVPLIAVQPGRVRVMVFDARGRQVATLLDGALAPGAHELVWDGMDTGGREVASGVYRIVMEALGRRSNRSVVLAR